MRFPARVFLFNSTPVTLANVCAMKLCIYRSVVLYAGGEAAAGKKSEQWRARLRARLPVNIALITDALSDHVFDFTMTIISGFAKNEAKHQKMKQGPRSCNVRVYPWRGAKFLPGIE